MLGTIEDLEKEIEQFQNNIASSGEMVQILKQIVNQIHVQTADFDENSKEIVQKMESLLESCNKMPEIINNNNNAQISSYIKDIDQLLEKRNVEFEQAQIKYLKALNETSTKIDECEIQLESKYARFIEMLKKMNVSYIYDQNIAIRKSINVRTVIIIIISSISMILGILGLFL